MGWHVGSNISGGGSNFEANRQAGGARGWRMEDGRERPQGRGNEGRGLKIEMRDSARREHGTGKSRGSAGKNACATGKAAGDGRGNGTRGAFRHTRGGCAPRQSLASTKSSQTGKNSGHIFSICAAPPLPQYIWQAGRNRTSNGIFDPKKPEINIVSLAKIS